MNGLHDHPGLTRLSRHLQLVNNVIRWWIVFFDVRLAANDANQLISSRSATRIIVSFEDHDLQLGAVPSLVDDNYWLAPCFAGIV